MAGRNSSNAWPASKSALPQPALQSRQGGTAVGTGINAHPEFAGLNRNSAELETGVALHARRQLFAVIWLAGHRSELIRPAEGHGGHLMKIANDLRWMNSGPLAGLGEIELAALQPGSSHHAGQGQPGDPGSHGMVAAQVIGNDAVITVAGQSGNFELNVMLPVIAHNLLQSIELMANSARLLADKAIASFKVNEAKLKEALSRYNPILVTALNPIIGYQKAAEIAKTAYQSRRPIIEVAAEMTDIPRPELEKLLDPRALTAGGIPRE